MTYVNWVHRRLMYEMAIVDGTQQFNDLLVLLHHRQFQWAHTVDGATLALKLCHDSVAFELHEIFDQINVLGDDGHTHWRTNAGAIVVVKWDPTKKKFASFLIARVCCQGQCILTCQLCD